MGDLVPIEQKAMFKMLADNLRTMYYQRIDADYEVLNDISYNEVRDAIDNANELISYLSF